MNQRDLGLLSVDVKAKDEVFGKLFFIGHDSMRKNIKLCLSFFGDSYATPYVPVALKDLYGHRLEIFEVSKIFTLDIRYTYSHSVLITIELERSLGDINQLLEIEAEKIAKEIVFTRDQQFWEEQLSMDAQIDKAYF
jgi:hypothetical protein